MSSGEDLFLTLKDVENQNEGTILVNSNWIYWQISELGRRNDAQDKISILLKVLSKVPDAKKSYLQMDIGDVKKCFSNRNDDFPINMFMRV